MCHIRLSNPIKQPPTLSRPGWFWGSIRGGNCILRNERHLHSYDSRMVMFEKLSCFFLLLLLWGSLVFGFVTLLFKFVPLRFFVPVYLSSGIFTMPEYLRLRWWSSQHRNTYSTPTILQIRWTENPYLSFHSGTSPLYFHQDIGRFCCFYFACII